jgi:hypothetical protein
MPRVRTIGSVKAELITKAKESALCAIKVFNDPLVKFKSEAFIVLMVIAWTYLLHAYNRSKGIDYRYYRQNARRKTYDKTKHGAKKHWELERCLDDPNSPVDKDTANNLRFLIGLRHEIEHQMTRALDNYLSGRYQACVLNFNDCLKSLFGGRHALDTHLTYTIQFVELTADQFRQAETHETLPRNLQNYIAGFDGALSHDEYNSPRYSYRLLFKKKLVNRPGQADKVIEFIDPSSDLAKTIDKQYWVKKEVERQKFLAKHVVAEVRKAGFSRFRTMPEHLNMWKSEDAKNPGKGYGTDVAGTWYWYESWIKRCIELCQAAGERYRWASEERLPADPADGAAEGWRSADHSTVKREEERDE